MENISTNNNNNLNSSNNINIVEKEEDKFDKNNFKNNYSDNENDNEINNQINNQESKENFDTYSNNNNKKIKKTENKNNFLDEDEVYNKYSSNKKFNNVLNSNINNKFSQENFMKNLLKVNEENITKENFKYFISSFFKQLSVTVDEVCADRNINSFVTQRVKFYLAFKIGYKLLMDGVFNQLVNNGVLKEKVVLKGIEILLGNKSFSNLFVEELAEDFPALKQENVRALKQEAENIKIAEGVFEAGIPEIGNETEKLKLLSSKLAFLTDAPQYTGRLNRLENGATAFELKDLDYEILPYSLNFASIYNEINNKMDDFFKKIGVFGNYKDARVMQLMDALKEIKTNALRKMSSFSVTRDNKIKEMFAEKGGKFSKLLREGFADERSSIKAIPNDFADLASLISSVSGVKNKFENLKKELKKKSEGFEFSRNDGVVRKEMFAYVSNMHNFMKGTEEVLTDLQKEINYFKSKETNLTFNVENLRKAKISFVKKLAQSLDFLVKRKSNKELEMVKIFNALKVDANFEELERAYNDFITAMINKRGLVSLEEIKKCCKAIGYELNEWNILNYGSQEDLLRVSRGGELRKLNQCIAKLLNELKNEKGAISVGNVVKLFRERAARDFMTIYSMRNIIQPVMDILGFNFSSMKSSKDLEKLKFELKDIKNNTVKETLINFIDELLNINNGVKTFEGMSWNRGGFYFDFQDKSLDRVVSYLKKLISNYNDLNLEFEGGKEKEEVAVSKNEVKENDEKFGDHDDEVKAFLDDGSANGYVVPLMGTDKHSIEKMQCEYKYDSDNSVLMVLKNVPAKENCGIVAIGLSEGKEGARVRLNPNLGILPFPIKSQMNEVHFYYSFPNDASTNVDPAGFIGSIRLTYLDEDNTRAKEFPVSLNVDYVAADTSSNSFKGVKEDTKIYDYGDKFIITYKGNLDKFLFIALNKNVQPVERMRYSLVTTKNDKKAIVLDDLQMLNKLGKKFELHIYDGELVAEKYVGKFKIDRDSTVSSNAKEEKSDKVKGKNKENVKDKESEKDKDKENEKDIVKGEEKEKNEAVNILLGNLNYDDFNGLGYDFEAEDFDYDLDYDF